MNRQLLDPSWGLGADDRSPLESRTRPGRTIPRLALCSASSAPHIASVEPHADHAVAAAADGRRDEYGPAGAPRRSRVEQLLAGGSLPTMRARASRGYAPSRRAARSAAALTRALASARSLATPGAAAAIWWRAATRTAISRTRHASSWKA